ncbi:hypothetical protein HOY80DRAFT_1000091 [Tuber brumale]|nr:hypothetical protein HOY80DRAFT_1000091 [Tuber brumale]
MLRLSKARLAQLQAARARKPQSHASNPTANSGLKARISIGVVKGWDAGWIGEDRGFLIPYSESDSEYDITSDQDGEEEEEVESGGSTGNEVTGDVVLSATGFLKDAGSKLAYELLDMYYEDDVYENVEEKEKKAKYRGESKASFYRARKGDTRERKGGIGLILYKGFI